MLAATAASVKRTYWALVENVPGAAELEASGTINTTVGPSTFNGLPADALKPAGTEWRVLAKHPLTTWLHLQPLTGMSVSVLSAMAHPREA